MNRLTTREYQWIIKCVGCLEESDCYECSCGEIEKAIKKLAEYEDLEEQDKLLRLPCKEGFIIHGHHIDTVELFEVFLFGHEPIYRYEGVCQLDDLPFVLTGTKEEIEQQVFISEEEAEAALDKLMFNVEE